METAFSVTKSFQLFTTREVQWIVHSEDEIEVGNSKSWTSIILKTLNAEKVFWILKARTDPLDWLFCRRTGLFSATLNAEVRQWLQMQLQNELHIQYCS